MATVSVRMEESLKKEAEELFDSFGITASTAVNMFYKAVVREQAMPFKISKNKVGTSEE